MSKDKYTNLRILAGIDEGVNYALEGLYEYGTLLEGDDTYPLIEGKTGPFMMANGMVKYFDDETGKIEEAKSDKDDGDKDKDDDEMEKKDDKKSNKPKKGVNPFPDKKGKKDKKDDDDDSSEKKKSDDDEKDSEKDDKKDKDGKDDNKKSKSSKKSDDGDKDVSSDDKDEEKSDDKKLDEAQEVIDNVDDKKAEDDKTGVKQRQENKVKCPKEVKASIKKRITELKNAIKLYDNKGYNDGSLKPNAVEMLEKIQKQLNVGTQESYQQAQLSFQRLTNAITSMFPATLIRFLSKGVHNNDK